MLHVALFMPGLFIYILTISFQQLLFNNLISTIIIEWRLFSNNLLSTLVS